MGASVILLRLGEDCSANSRRRASATKSRSDEPRFTAAILARFMRSSGRSRVVRINVLICFSANKLNPRFVEFHSRPIENYVYETTSYECDTFCDTLLGTDL